MWTFCIISIQCAHPALLLAAWNASVEACRLLLKFHANIDTVDEV